MNRQSFLVVIPTAGRVRELEKCLASISLCSGDHALFSFLVVDNNADAHLSENVGRLCRGYPFVQYVKCSEPGLSAARHKALGYTDFDVLCYVDDDVCFTDAWFSSTVEAFLDGEIHVAGGPTIPEFTSSVPAWFWDFLQSTPYSGWACPWLSLLDIGQDVDDINPNWIWGLNFAIRRETLLDCGGFHVDLVPKQYRRWQGDGETGLTMKLAAKGYKSVYRQNSLLFHQCGPDRLNPSYFAKRGYYQGVCNSYTALRNHLRSGSDVSSSNVQNPGLLPRALSKARRSVKNILQINNPKFQAQSPWAQSAAEVRILCQQAEREGYLFHQEEAARDPALREWICRDNYYDVDLRDLLAKHLNPTMPCKYSR